LLVILLNNGGVSVAPLEVFGDSIARELKRGGTRVAWNTPPGSGAYARDNINRTEDSQSAYLERSLAASSTGAVAKFAALLAKVFLDLP
jgi:hypothetical protein